MEKEILRGYISELGLGKLPIDEFGNLYYENVIFVLDNEIIIKNNPNNHGNLTDYINDLKFLYQRSHRVTSNEIKNTIIQSVKKAYQAIINDFKNNHEVSNISNMLNEQFDPLDENRFGRQLRYVLERFDAIVNPLSYINSIIEGKIPSCTLNDVSIINEKEKEISINYKESTYSVKLFDNSIEYRYEDDTFKIIHQYDSKLLDEKILIQNKEIMDTPNNYEISATLANYKFFPFYKDRDYENINKASFLTNHFTAKQLNKYINFNFKISDIKKNGE